MQEYEEYEKDEEAREAAEAKQAADVRAGVRCVSALLILAHMHAQDKAAAEERKRKYDELKSQNKKYMPPESDIAEIVDSMGFPRDHVISALRKHPDSKERAVDYILSPGFKPDPPEEPTKEDDIDKAFAADEKKSALSVPTFTRIVC